MNRFFALPLLFFFLFAADDCGDAFGELMGIGTQTELSKSTDAGVQAAGESPGALEAKAQAFADKNEALGKENLARGEKASLDKINNAIDLQPNDWSYSLTKAAMQVAMGQDSREAEGRGLTLIRRADLGTTDLSYTLAYSIALRDVSVNLPPGPGRDRVNKMLCPHVKEARATGDKSYEGVVCD